MWRWPGSGSSELGAQPPFLPEWKPVLTNMSARGLKRDKHLQVSSLRNRLYHRRDAEYAERNVSCDPARHPAGLINKAQCIDSLLREKFVLMRDPERDATQAGNEMDNRNFGLADGSLSTGRRHKN